LNSLPYNLDALVINSKCFKQSLSNLPSSLKLIKLNTKTFRNANYKEI